MSKIRWEKWDESKSYDYLDPRFQHAAGAIPDGTLVRFDDGDVGRVIHGNSKRSLIHWGNQRDWYNNDVLSIPVE